MPITAPVPAGFEPTGRQKDKQAMLMHKLLMRTMMTPERREWGFYIQTSKNLLQRLLGNEYRSVVEKLMASGDIKINERYSTGFEGRPAFSKSYRLAAQHRTGKTKLWAFGGKVAAKKLAPMNEVDMSKLEAHDRWLFSNLSHFTVDLSPDNNKMASWTGLTVSRLQRHDHHYAICDYHRRHTLITQLDRRFRSFLRLDKQETVEVDVSACQPLLLALLASTNHQPNNNPIVLICVPKLPPDLAEWVNLCEQREIYRYLRDQTLASGYQLKFRKWSGELKRWFPIDYSSMSERSFKRSALIPLFDRNAEMEVNPVFKIIARDFPAIASYLRRIKRDDYQASARLCQIVEAKLMIDGVCKKLFATNPADPVATIHDAILCQRDSAKTIADTIRNEFGRYGLNPQVKIG